MIVELAGPPGAGKTTMLPAALSFFREQGLAAFTIVESARPLTRRTLLGRLLHRLSPTPFREAFMWRLFLLFSFLYRLRFIARRPQLVWHVLRWQRQRPAEARSRERKVSFWLFRLMGYYEFLSSRLRADEVLILDEGFLHRVVQLFVSDVEEPNASRIRRYTKMIPAPDVAIFVIASPETCHKRIYERGLWDAFHGKDTDAVARFANNAYQATMIALKFSRAQGWPIAEVENEGDVPSAAQATLKRELSLLSEELIFDMGLEPA